MKRSAASDERMEQILLPFVQMERTVRARKGILHYDGQSVIILIVMLIPYVIGTAMFMIKANFTIKPVYGYLGTAWLFAFGALLIFSLATDISRHVKKKGYDQIAKSLKSLNAVDEEINEALELIATQGFLIFKYIDSETLYDKLKKEA